MAYDATEFARALEPPTLTVERRFRWWQYLFGWPQVVGRTKTYTGRILSHREWMPLQRRWLANHEALVAAFAAEDRARIAELEEESEALIHDTCDAIGIPAKVVLELPGRALQEALNDFLACQFRAHNPVGGGTTNQTKILRSRPATVSRNGSPMKTTPARTG